MNIFQRGQAMAEYTVVIWALITALLVVDNNMDCPGYDNCISKLTSVVHNQYQGYSNSITAIQRYQSFAEETSPRPTPVPPPVAPPLPPVIVPPPDPTPPADAGLSAAQVLTDSDGNTIGVVQPDGTVLDENGTPIGEYSDSAGMYSPYEGEPIVAGQTTGVTDSNGNVLQPKAVYDCRLEIKPRTPTNWIYETTDAGGQTAAFTTDNYSVVELSQGRDCVANTQQVVDADGNVDSGVVLDGRYYITFLGSEITEGGDGEVVSVNAVVPPRAPYEEKDWCKAINDCRVMAPLGWEELAGSGEELEKYLKKRDESPGTLVGFCYPNREITPSQSQAEFGACPDE